MSNLVVDEKIKNFNNLLNYLNLTDNSIIYPQEEKRKTQVIYKCPSGAMSVYSFIIAYPNKKSYLYLEYLDNINCQNLNNKLKCLANKIIFEEKTRIGEVGWEIVYTKQPKDFSLEERKKVFFSLIKDFHKHIETGMSGLNPKVGDILAAKPYGPKINQGFTEESLKIGKYQRSLFAKKFGFGELFEDGFQYGRYDKNLILRPI